MKQGWIVLFAFSMTIAMAEDQPLPLDHPESILLVQPEHKVFKKSYATLIKSKTQRGKKSKITTIKKTNPTELKTKKSTSSIHIHKKSTRKKR